MLCGCGPKKLTDGSTIHSFQDELALVGGHGEGRAAGRASRPHTSTSCLNMQPTASSMDALNTGTCLLLHPHYYYYMALPTERRSRLSSLYFPYFAIHCQQAYCFLLFKGLIFAHFYASFVFIAPLGLLMHFFIVTKVRSLWQKSLWVWQDLMIEVIFSQVFEIKVTLKTCCTWQKQCFELWNSLMCGDSSLPVSLSVDTRPMAVALLADSRQTKKTVRANWNVDNSDL